MPDRVCTVRRNDHVKTKIKFMPIDKHRPRDVWLHDIDLVVLEVAESVGFGGGTPQEALIECREDLIVAAVVFCNILEEPRQTCP